MSLKINSTDRTSQTTSKKKNLFQYSWSLFYSGAGAEEEIPFSHPLPERPNVWFECCQCNRECKWCRQNFQSGPVLRYLTDLQERRSPSPYNLGTTDLHGASIITPGRDISNVPLFHHPSTVNWIMTVSLQLCFPNAIHTLWTWYLEDVRMYFENSVRVDHRKKQEMLAKIGGAKGLLRAEDKIVFDEQILL